MGHFRRKALLAAGVLTAGYWGFRNLKRALRFFDYRNKVVLITGGSRGLGLVLARELASRGAHLVLLARDKDELLEARRQINAQYPECELLTVPCDLTQKYQISWAVKQVFLHFRSLDMVINNAGIISVMPYESASEDDFKDAMDTHFWGPFHLIEAVLPHFRAQRSGRIVNIGSIGGKVSVPHLAPYCASKFALTGYSEALRAELSKDNIFVTTVSPGLMRTHSAGHARFKGQETLEYAWFALSSSLPILTVSAEKAARAICDAAQVGKAEIVISLPAKLAVKIHALLPELASDMASLANHILPQPGSAYAAEKVSKKDNEGRI